MGPTSGSRSLCIVPCTMVTLHVVLAGVGRVHTVVCVACVESLRRGAQGYSIVSHLGYAFVFRLSSLWCTDKGVAMSRRTTGSSDDKTSSRESIDVTARSRCVSIRSDLRFQLSRRWQGGCDCTGTTTTTLPQVA